MKYTLDLLKKIYPNCPKERVEPSVALLNELMPKYRVDSILRQCSFLANVAVESGQFKYIRELWDPKKVPLQGTYERDFTKAWPPSAQEMKSRINNYKAFTLGNSEKGDGFTFRGAGWIQNTGRANILKASIYLFGDGRLVENPKLLDDYQTGALMAFWYWNDRNINQYADVRDHKMVCKKINGAATDGAPSHFLERQRVYDRCLPIITAAWNS